MNNYHHHHHHREESEWKTGTLIHTMAGYKKTAKPSKHHYKPETKDVKVSMIDRFEAHFVERCHCPGGPMSHRHKTGCPTRAIIIKNGSMIPIKVCKLCGKEGTSELCSFCWNAIKSEVVERHKLKVLAKKVEEMRGVVEWELYHLKSQETALENIYGKTKHPLFSEPAHHRGKESEEEEEEEHEKEIFYWEEDDF